MNKNIIITTATVLLITLAAGCGQKTAEPATRPFPVVRVPEIFGDDQQEAFAYMTEHFWDALADTTASYLCDSTHVGGVARDEVTKQFVDYITYLHMTDLPEAQRSIKRLYDVTSRCELSDTASNVFDFLLDLIDKYLYDPNSPYRDEDIYGAYAAEMAGFPLYTPEKQSYYRYQADLCALNQRGTQAADFVFRDARGRDRNLYSINAEYILLFFSNPGCPACKEIIETLSGELNVSALISAGKLAVANIYIDEDLQGWRDYMPIYPDNWYNGYDPNYLIRGETLYNVRAIPSLYLLDRDKTVLLKDAPNDVMFNELAYIANER
ncbi:MAG: DUF5106 domain-containing protein [Bacteroidales bacterium]|nr:DUF5106 domain-containing protein [Bacteroidales bacterium]